MKIKVYAFLSLLLSFSLAYAQDTKDNNDIFDMSLDKLMSMEVTSASKKAENIKDVPSSIYVITSEDIAHSGATNIMELLRDVPGYWGVSNDYLNSNGYIRNTYEGSVLVVLDGTPLLDLMWAEFQYGNFDIPLSMIDRIEVIKGSGGTVYGANSATGVISIFTKNPGDHEKVTADIKAAMPGYVDADFALSNHLSKKLAAQVYGKFSYFGGYNQLKETSDSTFTLKGVNGGEDQTLTNRFTANDNAVKTISGGLGLNYKASNLLTLSGNFHANAVLRNAYNQYNPPKYSYFVPDASFNPDPRVEDSTYFVKDNNSRIVANVKGQFTFSDKHSLFARVSTNHELSHYSMGGGFDTNNGIVDFELQDNLDLGFNEFSIGGNYRLINYNIHNIYSDDAIRFLENKRQENLKGAFIQDKVNIVKDKLSLYLGIKAENFSLLNDKFYFSPESKMVFTPSDKFTLWGGYTKSYTTPGYNQTDIEYTLFRAATPDAFYNFAYPLVQAGVYGQVYQQAVNNGADDAAAQAMAQAFITSPDGLALINATTNDQIAGNVSAFPGHYNAVAINGPNTQPASFSNYELGIRLQPLAKLYFETNLFYSKFENSIGNSPALFDKIQPSPTRPGEFVLPSYYGSYIKGTNYGAETIIKYQPTKNLSFEVSHSLLINDEKYQANSDFDISTLSAGELTIVDKSYPVVPKNVFRAKASIGLPSDIRFTVSGLYSTAYDNKFGTIESAYDFQGQRFDPLIGGSNSAYSTQFGKHNYRTIMNLRVDKSLMSKKLDIYVFGNDLFSSPFVESVNQLQTVYPRQVGRMVGVGVSYKL